MIVLSRKKNQSIIINNDITVTVVEVRDDMVRLGIVSPKEVPVHRQEVYEALYGTPGSGQEVSSEAGWLGCTDPHAMLEWLGDRSSARKLRLFACACCRGVWGWMTDARSRTAVEVAERYADGLAGPDELRAVNQGTADAWKAVWGQDGWHVYQSARAAFFACSAGAERFLLVSGEIQNAARNFVPADAGEPAAEQAASAERARQTALLRDLFGNSFRPVSFASAWHTPDVRALGQAAYEERGLPQGTLEPARLAVLADALEEAGCASADLLDHLRSAGPHVRGCWAVDLVLGKE